MYSHPQLKEIEKKFSVPYSTTKNNRDKKSVDLKIMLKIIEDKKITLDDLLCFTAPTTKKEVIDQIKILLGKLND